MKLVQVHFAVWCGYCRGGTYKQELVSVDDTLVRITKRTYQIN